MMNRLSGCTDVVIAFAAPLEKTAVFGQLFPDFLFVFSY
jgi:hypothetical protein